MAPRNGPALGPCYFQSLPGGLQNRATGVLNLGAPLPQPDSRVPSDLAPPASPFTCTLGFSLEERLGRRARGTPRATKDPAEEGCADSPSWKQSSAPACLPVTQAPSGSIAASRHPANPPVSPEEVRPVAGLPAIMPFLQPGLDLGVTFLLRICADT